MWPSQRKQRGHPVKEKAPVNKIQLPGKTERLSVNGEGCPKMYVAEDEGLVKPLEQKNGRHPS